MARRRADLVIVSYSNPQDVMGGAEQIAWAEAELLSRTRAVAFASASTPIEGAPFVQYRIAHWTRRLYRPGSLENPFRLGLLHLLSLFNPVAFVEAFWLFLRVRPRVVHTHNLIAISPAVWLAARSCGVRVVHTHHDLWALCEMATMTGLSGEPCEEREAICRLCKTLRPPKRAQLRLVSSEVFPSRWLRDRMHRSGTVVPSFATTYTEDTGPPLPATSTIAYVGGLTTHKLGALLEAFDLLEADSGDRFELAIVGAGPLEGEVARAAGRNPRIKPAGRLDPAARDELLAGAAALVIPSTCAEGSPLVFFEALAAGLPVVASDIGGITETGRFGNVVFVPPGNAQGLARALLDLLSDEEAMARLRAEALRNRSEASPERYAEAIGAVLDGVASESS